MKTIYLIRHCEAEGQPFEAQLTDRGKKQSAALAEFFSDKEIDRIISSPYRRAIQSIEPLAKQRHLEIEINQQLVERVLCEKNLSDWLEKLRETFENLDLKLDGGESSHEAMNRIVKVVEEVFRGGSNNTIIVTHGNLTSLLLKYYDRKIGFEDWQKLSNPDVFLLKNAENKVIFERLWEK